MLCSVQGGKGGPNWLDRLRSNKGFPIAHNNLDLDHFLLTNQNPDSTPPPNPNSNSPSRNRNRNRNPHGNASYSTITSILSDLFNMPPPAPSPNSKSSRIKKFPRKQSTPKICSIPSLSLHSHLYTFTDHHDKHHHILSSNSDNSSKPQDHPDADADADAEDHDLLGFSKTEVTIIDSSCDVWKSDKLIFRRKNLWKVNDKKPNSKFRSFGRNKRKHSSQPNHLSKLSASQDRFHFNIPSNNGYNAQHCSGPEMSANAPDSGTDKKENVYTLLQENGSYDPEKSDQPRA